jgi:hypothetical protein
MVARGLLGWLLLLTCAFANGTIREILIVPRTGELVAHAVSSVTLSLAILVLAWLIIPWIAPRSPGDAWTIGVVWLALTLAFELLAGHYLFGNSWSRLFADYNILRGRIWILVLLTTTAAPVIAAYGRGLVGYHQ